MLIFYIISQLFVCDASFISSNISASFINGKNTDASLIPPCSNASKANAFMADSLKNGMNMVIDSPFSVAILTNSSIFS